MLALVLTLGVAACASDAPDPTRPASAPVLDVTADKGPTCLSVDDALGAEVSKLPVIDCAQPHTHEVYATVRYTEKDVYPGLSALEDFARRACLEQFEPYVGVSVLDSSLTYTWMVPSLDGWTKEKDRTVLCVLAPFDGSTLTTVARGSKR